MQAPKPARSAVPSKDTLPSKVAEKEHGPFAFPQPAMQFHEIAQSLGISKALTCYYYKTAMRKLAADPRMKDLLELSVLASRLRTGVLPARGQRKTFIGTCAEQAPSELMERAL